MKSLEYDIIIVGGGIVGLSVAYGIGRQNKGLKVAVIDAPTEANKASRTNVGLIWGQAKFLDKLDYARWGLLACELFPELVKELEENTKIKQKVNFTGGLIPTLEEEYNGRSDYIDGLRKEIENYPGHMISRSELEKKLPKMQFGDGVCGAAWSETDGVIESLLLLRTFRKAIQNLGIDFYGDTLVYDLIAEGNNSYKIFTSKGEFHTEKVVLAAGLANRRLTNFANIKLPIFADKGQVLLTERLPYVMPIPILGFTQSFGGTVIIGFKHENRGHDATVIPSAVSQEGIWAMKIWPKLAKTRIIRSWPGLRIVPNDKVPIYSRLPNHPNVTVVNTHSAVTMAPVHTFHIAPYILGEELHNYAKDMTLKRFGFDC